MNNKSFLTLLTTDKQLRVIFSGMVISVIALLFVAVTAGIWYL
jgi:hypothetical protein